MPELPEVEVVVRHLEPLVRGLRIESVHVWRERTIRPHSAGELCGELTGKVFQGVTRRGKFLVFGLTDSKGGPAIDLIGHLGMTGRIYLQSASAPASRHAVVGLYLGKSCLVFEDRRQFGRMHLDSSVLEALGPEPLSDGFTPAILADLLGCSRQPVKVRLMNPSVVVGVGNIYASEALFRAQISPRRTSLSLERDEVIRLWNSIRRVLKEAIARGSSVSLESEAQRERLFHHGAAVAGEESADSDGLCVYDRGGLPCLQCGTMILRVRQAGRSTYYCPNCQPPEAKPRGCSARPPTRQPRERAKRGTRDR